MPQAPAPRPPRKKVYTLLFGDPQPIDHSGELTRAQIERILESHRGQVTLSIRESVGDANRGGYLFSIRVAKGGKIQLLTYTGKEACTFEDLDHFTRFVNHASGRRYDREMWELSQGINLQLLTESSDEKVGSEE